MKQAIDSIYVLSKKINCMPRVYYVKLMNHLRFQILIVIKADLYCIHSYNYNPYRSIEDNKEESEEIIT